MTKVRMAAGIQEDSIVDGEGIRAVIWFQGCSHKCPGCHNPETHDFEDGRLFDVDEIKSWIDELQDQDGITFSGGDPLMQPEALLKLLIYTKENGMNTWVYTGYTFEELMELSKANSVYLEVLKNIDILVDGRFMIDKRSLSCKFRGSTNQRVIDVAKSLEQGEVVKHYND